MAKEDDRRDSSPQEQPESPPEDSVLRAEEDGSVSDTKAEEEAVAAPEAATPYTPADDPYGAYDDPYGYNPYPETPTADTSTLDAPHEEAPVTKAEAPPPPPPPPSSESDEDMDADEEGMLRMSFLEHLEELRRRLLFAVGGLGAAFLISLSFSEWLWNFVQEPALSALKTLGYKDSSLVTTAPMEQFSIIYVKLPLVVGLFLASPWLLYQVWAFVAPGLYKRERRWAAPFIICSAGLFVTGGLFAYFVAFRFGLTFLLGIGKDIGVRPMITITDYFDLFVNVILGISVVFELPVLIFFLTLLRIASPRFLINNARYAVLGIVVLAAIITPTPDVVNLMLFSVPMVLLYFVGVFASYLLVLSRENRRFPWLIFLVAAAVPLLIMAGGVYLAVTRYGYKFVSYWPFLIR
jgi:sec-independent protein translocase protein TatC